METKNDQVYRNPITPEERSAWAAKKQNQRDMAYSFIESQTMHVFSDPKNMNDHLKRQAVFGKMGVSNVLLVGAQRSDARELRSFDEWSKRDRTVMRGEKAIVILETKGEYTQEDGTTRSNFDLKPVFDVSQTYGKDLRSKQYPPAKAVIKALLTKSEIPIEWNDHVKDAQYNPDTNKIEANQRLDADQLLYSVSREYAIADGADLFVAECVGITVCYRYSLMPEPFDYDFSAFQKKEPRELRNLLMDARKLYCNIYERIDKNLQKQRAQKQEER